MPIAPAELRTRERRPGSTAVGPCPLDGPRWSREPVLLRGAATPVSITGADKKPPPASQAHGRLRSRSPSATRTTGQAERQLITRIARTLLQAALRSSEDAPCTLLGGVLVGDASSYPRPARCTSPRATLPAAARAGPPCFIAGTESVGRANGPGPRRCSAACNNGSAPAANPSAIGGRWPSLKKKPFRPSMPCTPAGTGLWQALLVPLVKGSWTPRS